MTDYLSLGALEMGEAVRRGEIGVAELTSKSIKPAEVNALNAFISIDYSAALKRAEDVQRLVDSGELTSPLAGVPYAVKDNIDVAGYVTTRGSRVGNSVPAASAEVVKRLDAAGCVMLGKLNMDEFAFGCANETSAFGAVKNPRDTSRSPGGSSGGSAAAVAGFEAAFSLGTDTGGSIRQPSAWCGVVGFKPTNGLLPSSGVTPCAPSFDAVGPICRNVADCEAVFGVMAASAMAVSNDREVGNCEDTDKPIRVAMPKERLEGLTESVVWESVINAADRLAQSNAHFESDGIGRLARGNARVEIDEIDMPFFEQAVGVYYVLASAEARDVFGGAVFGGGGGNDIVSVDDFVESALARGGLGFGARKRLLFGGLARSGGFYGKAKAANEAILKRLDDIFARYDFILTPSSPRTAKLLGETAADKDEAYKYYMSDVFGVWANLAGLPSLSVPYRRGEGLPTGVQLTGRKWEDRRVLAVGKMLESAAHEAFLI